MKHRWLLLVLGLLLMVAGVYWLGRFLDRSTGGDSIRSADQQITAWLDRRTSDQGLEVMRAVTLLGYIVAAGITISLVFALWRKRERATLMAFFSTVILGSLLDTVLKLAFHPGRPTFHELIEIHNTLSFPSGHTMSATLLAGFILVLSLKTRKNGFVRAALVGGALLVVAFVAFSRMYVKAHSLSDVLGGFVAGLAWLAVCLTVFPLTPPNEQPRT